MCKKAKKILKKLNKIDPHTQLVKRIAEETDSPGVQQVLDPQGYQNQGKGDFAKKAKAEAQDKAAKADTYQKGQEAEARAKEADKVNAELLATKRKRKNSSLLATAGQGAGLGSGGSVLSAYGKSRLGE